MCLAPIHPGRQVVDAVSDTRGQVSEAPVQKSVANLDDLPLLELCTEQLLPPLGLGRHGGVSGSHRRQRQRKRAERYNPSREM
jgi:hypothetical protein